MPELEFVGRIGNPFHAGTRINRPGGQTLSSRFHLTFDEIGQSSPCEVREIKPGIRGFCL
jgi:hypothetical protein